MPRAYSQDLRDRVIDAVEIGGESRRSAARRFGVSEVTAVRWLQRIKHAGDRRCAGTGGHRPSKVMPERIWLLATIEAMPDITLAALSLRLLKERGVKADTGMLSWFFRAEGISFKKAVLPAEQDRPDIALKRARCRRGQCLQAKVPHGHWKTLTFLAMRIPTKSPSDSDLMAPIDSEIYSPMV